LPKYLSENIHPHIPPYEITPAIVDLVERIGGLWVFHELADSVDVRRSLVWVGQELSDSEVLKKVSDI
jgi:hypothetical protein